LIDLHTHHQRCGHATGSLRDYVEAALDSGVKVLGLSDHTPLFAVEGDHPIPVAAMSRSEFPAYLAEAVALRDEYRGRIDILVSAEADYSAGHLDAYSAALSGEPLDYVIGSVHVMDGKDIFDPTRWTDLTDEQVRSLKTRFFGIVADSARSGLFEVIGHVDALKGSYPRLSEIPTPRAVDDMLKAIVDTGCVMEINTSGGTKMCGGWYPDLDIIQRAFFYGVRITFSSDAHRPDRVGDQFADVTRTLREIGYRTYFVFKNRTAVPYAFPD
jgi:histidinol-phosphatase (PHP family)